MKKIILISTLFLISFLANSQVVINTVTATATADYYFQPRAGSLNAGSILFTTSNDFNGTNSTITIYVSNQSGTLMSAKRWVPLNGSDEITPIVFNLVTSGGNEKDYELRLGAIQHAWYKMSYTAGNATTGTLRGYAFLQ